MTITLRGTNLELTEALKAYVDEKIGGLTKFFDSIQQANVDIGMRSHHHQKGDIFYAEVNLQVPGELIRVVKEADDLYKAIDSVKDHLKIDLEKRKDKMRDKDKREIRSQKEYREEE
jgi:putative sigma-54 modulation protein